MRTFNDTDYQAWHALVGKKVWKNPKTTSKFQPKPFKSGNKVNTVKAIVAHDHTTNLAFTFVEDNSQVECFRCSLAPDEMPPLRGNEHGIVRRLEQEANENSLGAK